MAGHEWKDWFEREEMIGQISDMRVQNLQVERESVQKRTFTRWMNLHLEKCDPPIEVQDLFRDIQDGHILMALLEELSGCKLLHGFKKSSHRIFRLNNIAKVLSFLEERNVKLVSIDAADVADGNASIVLGLIWNIILFFQIKELTGNIRSQFPSCSSLSSIPTSSDSDTSSSAPSDERPPPSNPLREHSKAIKKLLQWVQRRTRKYGVAVHNFGNSWTSGLAFLAVIKSIDSSLVDMRKSLLRTPRENLEDAFRIAHYSLGIPRLLEPEDVTLNSPDEQSIIIYVSQFLEHFPGFEEPEEPLQVIERSVSMGRLNFRETDMDQYRNSHRGGRVRERSYMFQKDSAAPPPKILISSVSEDRGIVSPPFRQAATRSWSTEDFLSDSHIEDIIEDITSNVANELPKHVAEESQKSESPELRDSNSPTDSALPESVIGDSAISSPDSWMDSEYNVMPEKFCESRSDSSLCDSGTAWDIYRATPVEITNSDEGLAQSEDRLSDEQQESYIDEGICSLSSLESTQEKVDRQEVTANHVKDTETEIQEVQLEKQDCNGEIRGSDVCEVVEAEKASSMSISDSNGHNNDKEVIDSSKQPETEEQAAASVEEQVKTEGKVQSKVVNEVSEVADDSQVLKNECVMFDLESKEEVKQENEIVESAERQSKEMESDLKDVSFEVDLGLCSTNKESNANFGPMTITLISIFSEPDDHGLLGSDVEENYDADNFGQTEVPESKDVENDFENHGVIASCFITEHIDLIASEEMSDFNSGSLNEELDIVEPSKAIEEFVEIIEDGQDVISRIVLEDLAQSELSSEMPEMVILVSDPNEKLCETITDVEKASPQETPVDTVKSNGKVVSLDNNATRNEGFRGAMVELVDLEPMDLFYPDKEEPLYVEPAEDIQSWPSVLSVSPLLPAPASEDASDQQLCIQSQEDWTDEVKAEQTPAESQDQVTLVAFHSLDCLGDNSNEEDAAEPTAQDSTDPMRSYTNSCSGALDGNQIPPVLRHRKGPRSSEPTDNQRRRTSAADRDHISDYGLGDSWEPYVLLMLWLLLYCCWVLPQLDLKTVPSLFFNTRQ